MKKTNKRLSMNPLKTYISALIDNINKKHIPKEMDVVLDGGIFNGGYEYGILLLLKELERHKHTKIDKISGCSIGSILGFLYLIDKLDEKYDILNKTLEYIRENLSCKNLYSIVEEITELDFDLDKLNNKLFITYYDLVSNKQIVVSKYNSKDEIRETLIKSCHFPYMINGKIDYKERYCDGIVPFIFKKTERKTLFINLLTLNKMRNIIYIQNENNMITRVLNGIIDGNNFFSGNKSDMCSYINDWSLADFGFIRLRELILISIIILLKSSENVNEYIPEVLKNNNYIINIKSIVISLFNDIFSYVIL
jgi:hypothetical protein